MKRSRYKYEHNAYIDFNCFSHNDVIDYDTLCVWRLKKLYNQQQLNTLTLLEKNDLQEVIQEYKKEYYDILVRLNVYFIE